MLFKRTVLNETATSATPGFSASDGQYSVNAVSLRVGLHGSCMSISDVRATVLGQQRRNIRLRSAGLPAAALGIAGK